MSKPRFQLSGGVAKPVNQQAHNMITAQYEGASGASRMGNKGITGGSSANTESEYALERMRDRARHAVRNNPYATTAVDTYAANLIGNGIKPRFKNEEVQELWELSVNELDADGVDNFYGLQVLVSRGQYESGEVLTRFRTRRTTDNLAVPLQLQVLEGDHLPAGLNRNFSNGNFIRMGIGFNALGERSSYNLYRFHPGEKNNFVDNKLVSVPASDVLHVYRRLRPGQIRGITELAPILIKLYEIDEMQDATLVKQKTSALFGWIIKKRDTEKPFAPVGVDEGTDEDGVQLSRITPGGVHYLDDDEDIEFSNPSDIGSNYVEFLREELQASAKAAGLTYEQLTGNLRDVNYSSIRAGLIEFRRRIEQLQHHIIIFKFCAPVAKRWLDTAVMAGRVSIPNYFNEKHLHQPIWQTPRWEWVDPLKDGMADLLEVRSGFESRTNKIEERGHYRPELDEQIKEEREDGLVFDSDASQTTKQGALQLAMDVLKLEDKEDE